MRKKPILSKNKIYKYYTEIPKNVIRNHLFEINDKLKLNTSTWFVRPIVFLKLFDLIGVPFEVDGTIKPLNKDVICNLLMPYPEYEVRKRMREVNEELGFGINDMFIYPVVYDRIISEYG